MKKFPIFIACFFLSAWLLGSLIRSGPNDVLVSMNREERIALVNQMRGIEQRSNGAVDWSDLGGFVKHLLYSDSSHLEEIRINARNSQSKDLERALFPIEYKVNNIRGIPFMRAVAVSRTLQFIVSAFLGFLIMQIAFVVVRYFSDLATSLNTTNANKS